MHSGSETSDGIHAERLTGLCPVHGHLLKASNFEVSDVVYGSVLNSISFNWRLRFLDVVFTSVTLIFAVC